MEGSDHGYLFVLLTDVGDPSLLSRQLLFILNEAVSLDMITLEEQARGSPHVVLRVRPRHLASRLRSSSSADLPVPDRPSRLASSHVRRSAIISTCRYSARQQRPPQAPIYFAVTLVLGQCRRAMAVNPLCPFTGARRGATGGLFTRRPSSSTSISEGVVGASLDMKTTATVSVVRSALSRLIGAATLNLTISSLSLVVLLQC